MDFPRSGHPAVRLVSGDVLVTEGSGTSAELYDPAAREWELTGSMVEPRGGSTATLLGEGKVLVAGGNTRNLGAIGERLREEGVAVTVAELYDPSSGSWSLTGSMLSIRFDHTATLLENGKVLVVGGWNPASREVNGSAELFDPVTGTWSLTGSPAVARQSGHSATLLQDGKVLVTGGFTTARSDEVTSSAELYDPATGTWTATGSLAHPRANHTESLLEDGTVVVTGGRRPDGVVVGSTELYAAGIWAAAGSLNTPRALHSATVLPDGRVLAAGGYDGSASGEPTSSSELFDPATQTWEAAGFMGTARADHSATLLADGTVLAAGGIGPGGFFHVASAELYDPSAVSSTPLVVDDVSVTEGDSGTTAARFTVSLAEPVSEPVSVSFFTEPGSAGSGTDYTHTSGTLSFAAGETAKTVVVEVVGETVIELDESFTLILVAPSGAVIGDGAGAGTIVNDDFVVPSLSVSDVTVTETTGTAAPAAFTVSLSSSTSRAISVDFATSDGSAKAGADYAAASGTLSFAAGETSKTVVVDVVGDTLFETKEKFFVTLSNPDGATVGDAVAVGRILNDDPAPSLVIADVAQAEGTSSDPTPFLFTVTLSATSGASTTVSFATANGTAVAGSDYSAKTGTLTFRPGETTKAIKVAVTADTASEPNEVFRVKLTSAVNASIADAKGVGTIVNDD